jgi:hypothetical protein
MFGAEFRVRGAVVKSRKFCDQSCLRFRTYSMPDGILSPAKQDKRE